MCTISQGRGGEHGLEPGQVTLGIGRLAGPEVMGRVADEDSELTEASRRPWSVQNGAGP
ncbi:MAG: hypothetical protein WAL13_14850 [Trebonia sp.]